MKRTVLVLLYAGLFLMYSAGAAQAQLDSGPWPMLHHDPRHTARSVSYSGPRAPGILWSYNCGDNAGANPVISSGGTIYLSRYDTIVALGTDGSFKWSKGLGVRPTLSTLNRLYS